MNYQVVVNHAISVSEIAARSFLIVEAISVLSSLFPRSKLESGRKDIAAMPAGRQGAARPTIS